MKTNKAINAAIAKSAVITATLLALTGAAEAGQNFNKSRSWSTGNSAFGAAANYYASDSYQAPAWSNPGSYSVTAGGFATATVAGNTKTVLNGSGTVKIMSNGSGSVSAALSVMGSTVVNVSQSLPYTSPKFVRSASGAGSKKVYVLSVIPITFDLAYNASLEAALRVDVTTSASSWTAGTWMPRVGVKIGPVMDASATARTSAQVDLVLGRLTAGVTGSLNLGKAALAANIDLYPVIRNSGAQGGEAKVTLTAEESGTSGNISVYATGERWSIMKLKWVTVFDTGNVNVLSYSSGGSSTTLLGPATYVWF